MRKEGDIRAKKSLGQHFLNDEQLAGSIVESLVLPDSCKDVLEIGPGMGVLTKYLLNRTDIHLRLIEIDRESVSYLLQHYPKLNGVIMEGDFLQLNLPQLFSSSFAIIGNFPYNISTQILFRILELKDKVPVMVGMFQAEVAERIASGPGNRDYGILSVLLQPWYEMEILYEVPDSSFTPPPRVQSAVLRMIRNDRTSLRVDEVWFKKVIKQAFSMRRKTLRNALRPMMQQTTGEVPYLERRAETLSWQEFETLAIAIRS